ncbi:hypothetical protein KUCAC02_019381, partial [Chaenocephalus aceratus]
SQSEVSLDFMIDGRPRLPTPDHTNRDGIEIMLSHRLGELKLPLTLPFVSRTVCHTESGGDLRRLYLCGADKYRKFQ